MKDLEIVGNQTMRLTIRRKLYPDNFAFLSLNKMPASTFDPDCFYRVKAEAHN